MVRSMPRLTVIGSSDAFNSAGRFHSCYLLEGFADEPLMVDFGSTALAALRRRGREPNEIGAVLVTHLHGDHIGGFPHLLINGMYNEVRRTPLRIIGPVLTEERVMTYFQTAYPRLHERERPFDLTFVEIEPGERATLGGATVEAFAAQHMDPPDVPLCLRLTAPTGEVVAFSGDTEFCPGLLAAADGADLLVAECTALRPPAGRHLTWEEWQARWPEVRADRILLTHFNAEMRSLIPELRRAVPPGRRVDFAEDGLVLDV